MPGNPDPQQLATELRVVLGNLLRKHRERTYLGDLTWSQVSVLGRLDRNGPATVSALARAEGMRQQSMGANVAAVQAAGLVAGTPDPKDRRQTLLFLTDAGRAFVQANRAAREDQLHQAIQTHLTPAEQETLAAAIDLLKRLAAP